DVLHPTPAGDMIFEIGEDGYEIKGGKIRVMSKDVMKDILKRSPDPGDSLCLTFAPEPKKKQARALGKKRR
ncbi:MAG: hypothetical protein AAF485_11000, partial [Chloroflexota bacterium]